MRVFLVTGASSGIGRAIVRHCAAAFPDSAFVLTARRVEELLETAELANLSTDRVELVPLDISATEASDTLTARTRSRFGRLDVLVNNAGVGSAVGFEDVGSDAAIRLMVDVNLVAPILLSRACLDLLDATNGSIVNISSVAGLIGQPNSPAYAASKWALTGFSDSLRARVASRGIHVATIHPGPVPTPGWPHTALTSRALARPLYCDVDAISDAVVHAVRHRRASLVRPRIYAPLPIIRTLAPGLIRRALARTASASRRSN